MKAHILEAGIMLACRVPVALLEHLERATGVPAETVLKDCEGLIAVDEVPCVGVVRLTRPHYCWPSGGTPRFESLASWCRLRPVGPPVCRKIAFATERCVDYFGGAPANLNQNLWHALEVTEAYLAHDEETRGRWVSEDFFAIRHPKRLGDYVPDAAVFAKGGELLKVIEIGGRYYTPNRWREIYQACSRHHTPWEAW